MANNLDSIVSHKGQVDEGRRDFLRTGGLALAAAALGVTPGCPAPEVVNPVAPRQQTPEDIGGIIHSALEAGRYNSVPTFVGVYEQIRAEHPCDALGRPYANLTGYGTRAQQIVDGNFRAEQSGRALTATTSGVTYGRTLEGELRVTVAINGDRVSVEYVHADTGVVAQTRQYTTDENTKKSLLRQLIEGKTAEAVQAIETDSRINLPSHERNPMDYLEHLIGGDEWRYNTGTSRAECTRENKTLWWNFDAATKQLTFGSNTDVLQAITLTDDSVIEAVQGERSFTRVFNVTPALTGQALDYVTTRYTQLQTPSQTEEQRRGS